MPFMEDYLLMQRLEIIVDALNQQLNADQMDTARFERICKYMKTQTYARFKLVDFEFYNEERLALINAEDLNTVRGQDYESCVKQFKLTKNFMKHIRFQKYFKIEKSMFYSEENILIYFHTGTAKNDKTIYAHLTQPEKGFFINPNDDLIHPERE